MVRHPYIDWSLVKVMLFSLVTEYLVLVKSPELQHLTGTGVAVSVTSLTTLAPTSDWEGDSLDDGGVTELRLDEICLVKNTRIIIIPSTVREYEFFESDVSDDIHDVQSYRLEDGGVVTVAKL